jgi:hypothetical protein
MRMNSPPVASLQHLGRQLGGGRDARAVAAVEVDGGARRRRRDVELRRAPGRRRRRHALHERPADALAAVAEGRTAASVIAAGRSVSLARVMHYSIYAY